MARTVGRASIALRLLCWLGWLCWAGFAAPAVAQENDTCLDCHGDPELTFERDGREITLDVGAERFASSAHGKLDCVACHADLSGVEAFPHARDLAPVSCTDCHDDDDGPVTAYRASVHGQNAVGCAECHAPHATGAPGENARDACARCHAGAVEHWTLSVHGGDPGTGNFAADCDDCHGGAHDLLAAVDPRSRVYPLNLPQTCESCHHPDPSAEHPAPGGEKASQYETSVHGQGLRRLGLVVSATCASCHGSHDIQPARSPGASTARPQIPFTCGQCHAGILDTYLEGVHGAAFKAGVEDVPVCTDCHTEHAVKDPALADSSVSRELVAETCARCHADDALAQRYGFKSSVRSSFGNSYHGIASAFGERSAATARRATASTTCCPRAIRARGCIPTTSRRPAVVVTWARPRPSRAFTCTR